MKDKKFMLLIENDGETLFYSTNKKKDIDELIPIFFESETATKMTLYHKSGTGYEVIAQENKRKIGF